MLNNPFVGAGVALVTPFKKDFSIDFEALQKIIDYVIDGGIDFIVSLGTTGEAPTLSKKERKTIFEKTLEFVNGRIPLIANIGGNDTATVIRDMKFYPTTEFQGIMTIAPYYNKPSQLGLYEHFKKISIETKLPIILYNIPSRTGTFIECETLIRLAQDCPNIVGVKEASANMKHFNELMFRKPDNFAFLSGDDFLTYPILALGGSGVISVVANILPSLVSKMVREFKNKNYEKSLKLHLKQNNFLTLLSEECNPSGIKSIMGLNGFCENVLRLPLVPVSDEFGSKLKKEFNKLNSCKL